MKKIPIFKNTIHIEYDPSDRRKHWVHLTIGEEKITLTRDNLILLSNSLRETIDEYTNDILEDNYKALEFSNAVIACIKGEIGKVKIERLNTEGDPDYEVLPPGVYYYDVVYYSDVEDEIFYAIHGVPITFMPNDDLFYDVLKTYVGGNHPYTHKIAFEFSNFSLDRIKEEFALLKRLRDEEAVYESVAKE